MLNAKLAVNCAIQPNVLSVMLMLTGYLTGKDSANAVEAILKIMIVVINYLNQTSCLTCSIIPHCLNCFSKDNCAVCQKSYTLSSGKCICPESHYIDPKDNLCKGCEVGCL